MSLELGLLGKIKNSMFSSKKHEKILRALYRAGRRKGELELGSHSKNRASTSSSSMSSDDAATTPKSPSQKHREAEIIGGSAAAGTAAGAGAAYAGHKHSGSTGLDEVYSTSQGKVLTLPPRVSRQPLDKSYGGDFTDGKKPTDLKQGQKDVPVLDNDHPQYDNEAKPVEGHGQFYDPRDTQGGMYKTDIGETYDENKSSGHKPVGAAAAAGAAGLAGGVAVGGYGKDSEATKAELHQRDLKTKPAVYAEQERQEEIETAAYNEGRRKGLAEAGKKGRENQYLSTKTGLSLDPASEHQKNKSTYNEGGLRGATDEATHGQSGSHTAAYGAAGAVGAAGAAGVAHHESKLGATEGEPSSGGAGTVPGKTFAEQNLDTRSHTAEQYGGQKGESALPESGIAGSSAKSASKSTSKGADDSHGKTKSYGKEAAGAAGVAGVAGAGVAAHESGKGTESNTLDPASAGTAKSNVHAGEAPSSKNFDYDNEMKRLDQNIAQTQKEIDALDGKGSSHTQSLDPASDNSLSGKGFLGAAAAALGLGGAGYAAHESYEKSESKVADEAYSAGHAKGTTATKTSSDVESKAYDAGHSKGIATGSTSAAEADYSKMPGVPGGGVPESQPIHSAETSSTNPGLLGGAAGAAAAVGAAAALYIGFGGHSSTESGSLDPSLEKEAYESGHRKGTSETVTSPPASSGQPGVLASGGGAANLQSENTQAGTPLSHGSNAPRSGATDTEHSGYLDTAKAAVASAGVAAAGAFGYEGYNKYYNSNEPHPEGTTSSASHTKGLEADQVQPSTKPAATQAPDSIGEKKASGVSTTNSDYPKPSIDDDESTHPKSAAKGTAGAAAAGAGAAGIAAKEKATPDTKKHHAEVSSEGLDEHSKNTTDATSSPSRGGFLSKLGFGGKSPKGEASEESSTSLSGKTATGAVAGAVAGAAGAVGLTSSSTSGPHKVDSLVEEAAKGHEDVAKEPRHKTKKGNTVEGYEAKDSSMPDDLQPSQEKSSEAQTSGYDNTQLEKDIAAHNKKHGFTQNRNLVEVAEETHPEIKELPTHSKGTRAKLDPGAEDESSPRHRTPPE